MPEGPEVRRYADAVHNALAGQSITVLTARTKAAKAWLAENPEAFPGKRVVRVRSRGKNLVGDVENNLYFYAHLMMWGRWQVAEVDPEAPPDKRERARIVVDGGQTAVLMSAPVFEVGQGKAEIAVPYLASLGPDILPYADEGPFRSDCFLERFTSEANLSREIGAVLLDQTVAAGIGNYLRADILFVCGLSPFRTVADLTSDELLRLCQVIPQIARRAYETGGVSVTDEEQARMQADRSLIYANGSPVWGSRHYVFRRTNLPCLNCGTPIKQKRQVTHVMDDGEEKERVVYFCPVCQKV
jgi:DNA-formamidopyrimidine glycosylase